MFYENLPNKYKYVYQPLFLRVGMNLNEKSGDFPTCLGSKVSKPRNINELAALRPRADFARSPI